jgi:hypothetical protein
MVFRVHPAEAALDNLLQYFAERGSREPAGHAAARPGADGRQRVRRGVHAPAALAREQVVADPWILAPRLFDRACIASWSAAEHRG